MGNVPVHVLWLSSLPNSRQLLAKEMKRLTLDRRICKFLSFAMCLLCIQCVAGQSAGGGSASTAAALRDGQHDFDFEIGTWKTHLRLSSRLTHPFTGEEAWADYSGTSVVRKIWNGKANMVELSVDGPSGHVEGLNLHLYNPGSHQWSLNFANSATGTLGVPTVGEFRNGRGEFYDLEPVRGRMLLVRNIWIILSPDACHFEQAFSQDGGKTWEVNWIADDTKVDTVSTATLFEEEEL